MHSLLCAGRLPQDYFYVYTKLQTFNIENQLEIIGFTWKGIIISFLECWEDEICFISHQNKKIQISGHFKDPRPIVLAMAKLNNTLN